MYLRYFKVIIFVGALVFCGVSYGVFQNAFIKIGSGVIKQEGKYLRSIAKEGGRYVEFTQKRQEATSFSIFSVVMLDKKRTKKEPWESDCRVQDGHSGYFLQYTHHSQSPFLFVKQRDVPGTKWVFQAKKILKNTSKSVRFNETKPDKIIPAMLLQDKVILILE